MTRIEPLRKLRARRRPQGRPSPLFDLLAVAAVVVLAIVFRRRLGRAATDRTGTWVGTIR